jgi:hypothetical protein
LETLLPFLHVQGPDGQQFSIELAKDNVTIGRYEQFNDVALQPDPQQLITRKVHCVERDAHGWWVVDNGGPNRKKSPRPKSKVCAECGKDVGREIDKQEQGEYLCIHLLASQWAQ